MKLPPLVKVTFFAVQLGYQIDSTKSKGDASLYISIGCFRYTQPSDHTFKSDSLAKCHAYALRDRFDYFAIQNQNCYIFNKEFSLLYSQYEVSLNCSNGTGGVEDIDVYAVIVDGAWGAWSHWTDCSSSCKGGRKMRYRWCNNPSPSQLGKQCETENKIISSYETEEISCDNEVYCDLCKVRNEKGGCCTIPFNYKGESYNGCIKGRDDKLWCGMKNYISSLPLRRDWEYCAINQFGTWEKWSSWGKCSLTCNGGKRMRIRICNKSTDLNGDLRCKRADGVSSFDIQEKRCNRHIICPIMGKWSEWKKLSQCSKFGNQTKFRTCSDPSPQFGGLQCEMEKSPHLRTTYESKQFYCKLIVPREDKTPMLICVSVGGVVLLLVIIMLMICICNRRRGKNKHVGLSVNVSTTRKNIESSHRVYCGVK